MIIPRGKATASSRAAAETSEQNNEQQKAGVLEQGSDSVIVVDIALKDLTCPVTQSLFFDPVSAAPCGHSLERSISRRFLNNPCPTCREKIVTFGKALLHRNLMNEVLTQKPILHKDVYFNFNHFATIVRQNELNTPIGQRFITLLQHAATHLNDKTVGSTRHNKTAIEVLAETYEGREVLRHNKEMQKLISEKSKQVSVGGKTISEWLAIKEEAPETAKSAPSANPAGLFASSASPEATPQPPDAVYQHVVYGNEEDVLDRIRENPRLVEQKATVVNYSGRTIDEATPFQMALREGDEIMAEKIKTSYLESNPDGEALLEAQYNEIFPDGYAAHLEEQKQSADSFERDYLDPLIETITNASPADLEAALNKDENGSELCQKLNAFKVTFTALSYRESVYNPLHLIKALDKRESKYSEWYINDDNPHRWLRLDLFWRQVIGWEERYMTANYAQSFCTGLANMIENQQPLRRTLSLHNYDTDRDIPFFPLDTDPSSALGSDFGVYSLFHQHAVGTERYGQAWGGVGSAFIAKLVSRKNSCMESMIQHRARALHVHAAP